MPSLHDTHLTVVQVCANYGQLGMPLIRKLAPGLWEVRSHLDSGIARVIFTVDGSPMVLLHAFVMKAQRTPPGDMKTAQQRLADLYKDAQSE